LEIIPALILWLLLPAWIVTGFLDWIFHRKSSIAEHCGPWESILHLLLLAEAGTALLIGLLLELNEPALALVALCFIVHEITGYLDIRFAHARRNLSPAEQRLHDYMTAIPVTALFLVGVLHGNTVASLLSDPIRIFTVPLQAKATPLPVAQVLGILGAVVIVDLIPYVEELRRGLRARRLRS
jgi:membrane-associated HD superfamily phosphohydrolase